MGEDPYWFEEVPEEQRYWFLVQWGTPRSAEQWAEREPSQPPPGVDPEEFQERLTRMQEIMQRAGAVGYAPAALSPPWWTEAELRWEHDEGPEFVSAPQLYTSKEAAERDLRDLEDRDPESYLALVERYGEELTNRALDNTSPLRAVWIDRALLLEKLEDAEFLCVRVDDQLKLRQDFMEELRELEEG